MELMISNLPLGIIRRSLDNSWKALIKSDQH
jgi:hypothetical protein